MGDIRNRVTSPLRVAFSVMTACTCSIYLTSVSVPAQESVSMCKMSVWLLVNCLRRLRNLNEVSKNYNRYTNLMELMLPASQWYLAGTVFQVLARAVMAPASRTPKPKRWLNSKPTPFIFQWNRPFESYRELRLEVRTLRCWMSRHVNVGLLSKEWKIS